MMFKIGKRESRWAISVVIFVALATTTGLVGADEPFVLVPAPGKVVVDGKSDDWDLSGAYGPRTFDPEFLGEYDATFYGMYDDTNLYLFFHVHDATPLINKGIVEEGNYWAGDSIEIRFSLNPGDGVPPKQESPDIRHIALWYNSDREKPQYKIQATMKYETWPDTGLQVVFRKWEDGRGWDCEMAVPWKTLSETQRPKPGDYIGWCMAVLMGNQAGTGFWRKINVLANDINYQSTSEWHTPGAFLSPTGKVPLNPRTQTPPAAKGPGGIPITHIEYTLSRAGEVSLAVYDTQGRLVRTLLVAEPQDAGPQRVAWDGYDDDGNPLPPGEYRWKLAVGDGVRPTYVMGLLNGGTPKYPTADGKGSWGGIWGNVVDTAADESGVYLLWEMEEGQGALVKIDPQGMVIWKQHIPQALAAYQSCLASNGEYVVVACGRGLWRVKASNGEYAPFTAKDPYVQLPPPQGWKDLKPEERVQRVPELARLPFLSAVEQHITGIAVEGNRIYVSRVLENAIEVYDMTDAQKKQEVKVERPFGLEVHRGKLYVVSGKQILRFDARTLASEGVAVSSDLDQPYGLAVDKWGNFWVTDLGNSQQVKRFSAEGKLLGAFGKPGGRPLSGGKFIKEDFLYATGICVEPHTGQVFLGEDVAPRRVVALDSSGRFLREWLGPYYWGGAGFLVDTKHDPYQLYAFTGASIIRFNLNLQEGTSELDAVWPQVDFRGSEGQQILYWYYRQGRMLYHDNQPYLGICGHDVHIFRVDGYRLLPAAFVSTRRFDKLATLSADFASEKSRGATWHDANGNGTVEAEEVTVYPELPVTYSPQYWGPSLEEDFSLLDLMADGVRRGPDGSLYYNRWIYAQPGENVKGLDWAGRLVTTGVVKINPDGQAAWQALRKAESFRRPWEAYAVSYIDGPFQGCIFADDCSGSQTYVIDGDGLILGTLYQDVMRGPSPSPYTLYVEHFTSAYFSDPRTGYLYAMTGSDDIRIFRISGLDTYQRLTGTVTFTETPRPRVAAQPVGERVARAVRFRQAPRIDGDLAEWQGVPEQTLAVGAPGEEMSATFRLGWDDRNLYAAFHVVDSSPMVNSGKMLDTLFKYGDALSLYLACDPAAPVGRKEPVPGDVRLLLTKYQDKPLVVVYRARVPGTQHPAVFTSAVGRYVIDVVEPVQGATLAFRTDADGKGYTAELSVPLAALPPLTPKAGLKIGFDAAADFSDAAGQFNAAKTYWTGREAMVRDIPTEANFFQDKWGVLEFVEQ